MLIISFHSGLLMYNKYHNVVFCSCFARRKYGRPNKVSFWIGCCCCCCCCSGMFDFGIRFVEERQQCWDCASGFNLFQVSPCQAHPPHFRFFRPKNQCLHESKAGHGFSVQFGMSITRRTGSVIISDYREKRQAMPELPNVVHRIQADLDVLRGN